MNSRMTQMVAMLVALFSLSAFADLTPVKLDGDLSGQYHFKGNNKNRKIEFDFFLVKTPMTIKGRDGVEHAFYGLSQAWYDNIKEETHLLGVAMTADQRAPEKFRLQYLYVSKGRPIDGESSMVLKQEDNTLIFGGDFETYETFRITKISDRQF